MFDVIAIGDTTQDIFLQMSDASLQCDLDGNNCKICFDFADKIAVEKKTDVPAVGNAANHAIGIARMGLKAGLFAVVGEDAQGKRTKEVLEENKVDTEYLAFDKAHGTNLSIVINYRSERTIFVYHEPRDYKLPEFAPAKWVYLTSASGDGVDGLHAQTLAYLQKNPAVGLAFNPGTHQMHLGKEKLKPLLARTNILFLNREECQRVLEVKTSDIKELTQAFHKLGVKTMVITDGPKGAYASDGKQIWFLDIFEGPVVERTGTGDAFGSGFLAAIVKGKDIPTAMLWGNANSTSVVQYIGAREGLLEESAALHMIEEQAGIKPKLYTS
ncbi:MAG: carbohydrate kinase family protein [Candidatus Andersenbacteria bacterium]|nr:carbohydrate kinase family protein [Candidatus Andersenbacteria bacterium]